MGIRSVDKVLERRRGLAFHHIVLGCGPAGISSAIHLQRAGYRVLVIERATSIPAGAAWSNQRWLHSRGEFYLFTTPEVDTALAFARDLRHGADQLKRWARGHRISEKRSRPSVALARTAVDLAEMCVRQRAIGIEPRVLSELDLREILPIRRGVFVGGVVTADAPINPPRLYRALVEQFIRAGGVLWLGAGLKEVEDGFAVAYPTGEAAAAGGVREYRNEGVNLLTWSWNEISFADRLVYACGYGLRALHHEHFPQAFNAANKLRVFAATKLFGRLGSRVGVAFVADPGQRHPAGFSLVEHADGYATLCSTRESLNVVDHLSDPEDFSTVVSHGAHALRELCLTELLVEGRHLDSFNAQRCTKVDIVNQSGESRSRSNVLLAPSDWQLVALAGKATLAPLLGEDVAAFVRENHPRPQGVLTPFPFVARMPGNDVLSESPSDLQGVDAANRKRNQG